jgi:hypothetical protein
MGSEPKAEFLAQIALRQKLIERSKKIIITSKALVEQSHRLIGIAMGHDVDGELVRTEGKQVSTGRGSNLE